MDLMLKSKIHPEEWEFEFQQRNEQPILAADLMGRGFYYGLKKEIRLPIPSIDFLFTATSKGYVKKKQEKIIIDALRRGIRQESYLKYVFDSTKKRMHELDAFTDRLIKCVNEQILLSNDLARLWKEFDRMFLEVYPWFCIPWYITEENMLSDKVKSGLLKHKGVIQKYTDLNNALLILIFPTMSFLVQAEQAHFYKLVCFAGRHKGFSKNHDFIKLAKNYLQKYAWINTFFILPIKPLNFNQLVLRVNHALRERFIEQYTLQKSISAKNKNLARVLMHHLRSDRDLTKTIEWSRKYGWLLNWSVEQALISFVKLQSFFKLIAKETNVPYRDWVHFTAQEVSRGLTGKRRFSRSEIKKRKHGHVFLIEKGRIRLFYGKEAKKLSDKLDTAIDSIDAAKITEIQGQSASPGMAKGKIRRAMIAKETFRVRGGDILLCVMTSPDYVPAMNRAAAIVTDEGGLLCHAAIVSRELGKPCVVGTKFATKILKDGDDVEVDADKGLVRILNKR